MITLKLNNVETTLRVKQDNYAKSTGKSVKSVFPKQTACSEERLNLNTKISNVKKTSTGVRKGLDMELRVTSHRFNLSDPKINGKKRQDHLILSNRGVDKCVQPVNPDRTVVSNADYSIDTLKDNVSQAATQEIKHTFNSHQKEMECDGSNISGKMTTNTLHGTKRTKSSRKQTVRTALVYIGRDSADVYSRGQHVVLGGKSYTHNSHYQKYLEGTQNYRKSIDHVNILDNETNILDSTDVLKSHVSKKDSFLDIQESTRKSTMAVTPLLFTLPSNHKVLGSYSYGVQPAIINSNPTTVNTDSGAKDTLHRQKYHSVADDDANKRGKTTYTNTAQMKTVRLEVFSERRVLKVPGKIPRGRITYSPNMPAYKLDLKDYPPSNALGPCRQSSSADDLDKQLLYSVHDSPHLSLTSRQDLSQVKTDSLMRLPLTSDIAIRFCGSGEVILSKFRHKGADR